jgi:hypothetical protein
MRQLSGKAKKAILGLVLAMSVGVGGRAFAGQGYYCWVECNGCYYEVYGCDSCSWSVINCTASGTNCQGDYGHCG